MILCTGGATAASLDLPGTYGTPAGCKYAADGQYGDEDVWLLDAEHFENFVTHCEFVQVLPARDGSQIVTMLCGHEGEESQTIETVRIAKGADGDAYSIFRETGEIWVTIASCGVKNEAGK